MPPPDKRTGLRALRRRWMGPAGAATLGAFALGLAACDSGSTNGSSAATAEQQTAAGSQAPPVRQELRGAPREFAAISHLREGAAPQEILRIGGVGSISVTCSKTTSVVHFRADARLPTASLLMTDAASGRSVSRTLQPGKAGQVEAGAMRGSFITLSVSPFSKGPTELTTASIAISPAAGRPYYACDIGARVDVAPVG